MNELLELVKKYDSATFPVYVHITSSCDISDDLGVNVTFYVGGVINVENQRFIRGTLNASFLQEAVDWLNKQYEVHHDKK